MRRLAGLLAASALAGCNLAPAYRQPPPAIPQSLPSGGVYPQTTPAAAGASWRTLIGDDKLRQVIDRGLAQNRDLRAALAQVGSARALYGVQRASQLPSVSAGLTAAYRGGDGASPPPRLFDASIGFSSFEIDLFGRLRNLSKAAFEQYVASEAGARSTRITLVTEIATAYVVYAYDLDVLRIGGETRDIAQRSLELTQSLHGAGLADRLDVTEAETSLHQAESDIASARTQVAQDRNALELLVGAPVEDALLPTSLDALDAGISAPPAGASSDVLLQRPDVLQAEARLKGANANIGAARAAYFPRISLTAADGVASTALSSLFSGGNESWSATPAVSQPIFAPSVGSNVAYAKAQRDLLLAQYEGAVQIAFREVSDALARQGTIDEQRKAQAALVASSEEALQLADQRYRAGIDTFLSTLTVQRTLDAARRSAAATSLVELTNRLTLYKVLGGAPSD
ncbi:MAG: efflux transporter outer membrane subunit [Alphaproteobacteria bacterium]|nr:efflux transporter outer membrane subunit [Alphaproteobacteria bacterium]